jgi:hypothetical protein
MEIVPQGPNQFQVLFEGKPASDAEVVFLPPEGKEQTLSADGQGKFQLKPRSAATFMEFTPGSSKTRPTRRQKFDEIRHYATLVVRSE